MTERKRRAYKDFPTSVHLSEEQLRGLDRISAAAREIHPRHPRRARMKLVSFAVDRLLADPQAIKQALEE